MIEPGAWVEIEIDPAGAEVRAAGRGSRGQRPAPHTLGPDLTVERLADFTRRVGAAVRGGKPVGATLLADAQALHEGLFRGELRDVITRASESSGTGRLLLRLMIGDRVLQGVPWEAACRPGTTVGFLGSSSKLLVARGVTSSDAWEPRGVEGAVRVLAIAPSSGDQALAGLEDALAGSVDAGEIEWLPPIVGAAASPQYLFDRLRRGPAPHVLHFLGHGGVDGAGRPVLRLDDDEDDEESWIAVEALADELGASFGGDLRLVVLEACEGGRPGELGSGAELLARAGADAVVAHLWPIKTDFARSCSRAFYRALTSAQREHGDVAASLSAARRTLLMNGAEGFAPVLYLRGTSPVLFDFEGRRVTPPAGPAPVSLRAPADLDPALSALLARPFSVLVGERDGGRTALADEVRRFLVEGGEPDARRLPPDELLERCVWRAGADALASLLQQGLASSLDAPPPPLVDALGRLAGPGVHASLLWLPHLERAIARHQPQRTLHVVQPARPSSAKPRVITRPAGAATWRASATPPDPGELSTDIVVLRLDGGYSCEAVPAFTPPMLTEDERFDGLVGAQGFCKPEWAEPLATALSSRPALFAGISAVDLQQRNLLSWIFGRRQAAPGSLAVVDRGGDPDEPEVWESGGCLKGRVGVLLAAPDAIGAAIGARAAPAAPAARGARAPHARGVA